MRRLFIFLLICILTGCGASKNDFSVMGPSEQEMPQATKTPASVNEFSFSISTPIPSETAMPASPVPAFLLAPTLTPVISGERYAADEGVYTVAWISDTQHYANTFPYIYPTITQFLHDHKDEMHLVYAIHTGDLVHQNGDEENWKRASDAMNILGDIPYGVLAGNHDMADKGGGYANYGKYFGESRFSGYKCFGKSFENNRGHYDLLTIGNTDYIFVYMSHAPDAKALEFIKKAFLSYPERIGVLCVHDFMTTEGTRSSAGDTIREKVLRKCPNCYLVLCGHRYGLYCIEDTFDDDSDGRPDRTVYEMMQNYQAAGKEGGSGYFRLMQFDDAAGIIHVLTYSAYLDDYNWLDDPSHKEERYMMDENSEQFDIVMPWRG